MMPAMREPVARVSNELNTLPETGVGEKHKHATLRDNLNNSELERKGGPSLQKTEPKDKEEAGNKIHQIKEELAALINRQEKRAVKNAQISQDRPPTLMERFRKALKRLKEWFARRRRKKATFPLRPLPDKQTEWIPVSVGGENIKALPPGFILGECKKEGMAEKVITVIERVFEYLAKAFKAVFSKKDKNQSPENSQPANKLLSPKSS